MSTHAFTATPAELSALQRVRDELSTLGHAIRDAVRPHAPGGSHTQVTARCDVRGVRVCTTVAALAVRVGEWRVGVRVEIDGIAPDDAARSAVRALCARIEAHGAWHRAMATACDAALTDAEHALTDAERALTDEERAALDCGGLFGKDGER